VVAEAEAHFVWEYDIGPASICNWWSDTGEVNHAISTHVSRRDVRWTADPARGSSIPWLETGMIEAEQQRGFGDALNLVPACMRFAPASASDVNRIADLKPCGSRWIR